MKCNKCNRELPNDSEFCQYCGNKFETNNVQLEPSTNTVDVIPKNKAHKAKKKSVKIISLILSFVIVIGATAGVTLHLVHSKEKTKTAATKPKTVDKDYIYSWLLENGKLVDGTELTYKVANKDGTSISLSYSPAKYSHTVYNESNFRVNYNIPDLNGYNVDISMLLFVDSNTIYTYYDFTNNTSQIDCWVLYKHKRKTFAKNSPIIYDDRYYDTTPPYAFKSGGTKVELSEEEKSRIAAVNATADEVAEMFTDAMAQEYLCELLNCLKDEICPAVDCTMADLGYKNYK